MQSRLASVVLLATGIGFAGSTSACEVTVVRLPELTKGSDAVFSGRVSGIELQPFKLGSEEGVKGWVIIQPTGRIRGELPTRPLSAPVASLEIGSAPCCIEPRFVPQVGEHLIVWTTKSPDGQADIEFSPGQPTRAELAEIRKQKRD